MWEDFDRHCAGMGIEGYEKVTVDICDLDQVASFPKHEFVHCAGVIYHVSDPLQFVQNIARVTTEYAIISSMTIPSVIKNNKGSLITPTGTAHSVNIMEESNRQTARKFFESAGLDPTVVDARPYDELFLKDGRVNTGPWWWLYTIDTLVAWCKLCGLEVLDQDCSPNGAFSSVLFRKMG